MNNNEIPQDYKDSPLGIIPQEWEVKRLGEIASFFSGGTPKSSENLYYNGSIPFIKSGEIYSSNTEQYLSEEGLLMSSAKKVEIGDLLYALYGANSGECAISKINGAINQAVLCIRARMNNYLLLSILEMNKRFYIASYLQGGQGNLSADIVKKYTIPIPPLPEQEKIAETLGLWDEAIERQAKIVDLLITRKRALMQRLLKPKKHWEKARLGNLFTHIKETNDGKEHVVMTISGKSGLISQENKFDRIIAGESLKKYTLLKKGDFAYNKGNSKTYPMGCIYKLDSSETALVPFVYICFRSKKSVDLEFYKFFFSNHGLDRQLNQIITSGARGDGLLNVNKEDFFDLRIPLPPLPEQTYIAEVLSTADSEINLARKKLESLRTQKKGLMQQLLTGKKRVKI